MKTGTGPSLRQLPNAEAHLTLDALSWEPFENFKSCERLLQSFWAEIGQVNTNNTRPYIPQAGMDTVGSEVLQGDVLQAENIPLTAPDRRWYGRAVNSIRK